MSANLFEKCRSSNPIRFRTPPNIDECTELEQPRRRVTNQSVTSDAEIAFIKKAVLWMLFLSVAPLILFHIVNYFHPEIFLAPIAPN